MAEAQVDKTGTTWLSELPCPKCGRTTVVGYLLVNEKGDHMHTRYVCTFWPSNPPIVLTESLTRPCGWDGWTIPGWNEER